MEAQLSIFIRVFLFAFVIAGFSLFLTVPGKSIWLLATVAIVVIVALIGIFAATEKIRNKKAGLPLEDELSKKINWKAGYYAFLTGLWLAIGIMAASFIATEFFNFPEREFKYAFELLIIVPALVFVALSFVFRRNAGIGA